MMTQQAVQEALPTTKSSGMASFVRLAGLNEKQQFERVFEVMAQDVVRELPQYRLPENGLEWVKKMMHANVPGGKMNRGLTVVSALQSILKRELTDVEYFKSAVLGWCVEWLQAFFLVADDIMDQSVTRRGNPCWYRQDNVGLIAINDAFILESLIYKFLKFYFRQDAYYVDIMELFHETSYQTELGQLMDLLTAPEDHVDLAQFSIEKHAYIVEYKTAYYSFYLPIALAMHMAGIQDKTAYQQAMRILIPLGEYFQVQDDYLDCYGDPAVIGKIGTDIQDNKCSWLINQALALASPQQRALLDENYGRKDAQKEKIVKEIFLALDMEGVYKRYEDESYTRLSHLIEQLDETQLPKSMFYQFMDRIYKRTK